MNELRRTNHDMEVKLVIYDVIAGRRKNLDDLSPNFINDLQKEVAKHREEVQKRMQELCSMDSSKPTWRDRCMCSSPFFLKSSPSFSTLMLLKLLNSVFFEKKKFI